MLTSTYSALVSLLLCITYTYTYALINKLLFQNPFPPIEKYSPMFHLGSASAYVRVCTCVYVCVYLCNTFFQTIRH